MCGVLLDPLTLVVKAFGENRLGYDTCFSDFSAVVGGLGLFSCVFDQLLSHIFILPLWFYFMCETVNCNSRRTQLCTKALKKLVIICKPCNSIDASLTVEMCFHTDISLCLPTHTHTHQDQHLSMHKMLHVFSLFLQPRC